MPRKIQRLKFVYLLKMYKRNKNKYSSNETRISRSISYEIVHKYVVLTQHFTNLSNLFGIPLTGSYLYLKIWRTGSVFARCIQMNNNECASAM